MGERLWNYKRMVRVIGSLVLASSAAIASAGGGSGEVEVARAQAEPTATQGTEGALIINGHSAPFTRTEIEQYYQLDPLHSRACDNNPSSRECVEVWNRCNANPQKPVKERVKGCFDRYTTLSPYLPPLVELTGFTSEIPQGVSDPNQAVYTPFSE